MPEKEKPQPPPKDAVAPGAPELNNPDFQFVLKALLAAYQPILEQQLNLAKNPEALQKEAQDHPPKCADEVADADRLFGKFFSEDVAQRMIPLAARERLGPVENLRWCLSHLRCCFIFGWLICRGPRNFRAWSYYVNQYWRCVRQTLGTPVADPPTEEERRDFRVLIEALAAAYKPYLTDELATVEFPAGIPDDVLAEKINCFEGHRNPCVIFERLLTTNAAQALLGRQAFSTHRKDPNFWFCRCWCLCAICFGCCLARTRSFVDVYWCLVYFFRCMEDCFKPLHCQLTGPTGCIRGESNILAGKILEPVVGSAYGFNFDHYVIEVRDPSSVLLSGVVIYPNAFDTPDLALTRGNFAVAAGTLGWIDLQKAVLDAGPHLLISTTFTVTLRVFATNGTELTPDCVTTFNLSVDEVYIKRISTPWSVNFTDPNEPLRAANNVASALATEGGGMHVRGNADVFGCTGQKIQEYTIWAIPDPAFAFPEPAALSIVTPGGTWIKVTHIDYTSQIIPQPVGPPITYTADDVRADNRLNGNPDPSILTNVWGVRTECPSFLIDAIDFVHCWNLPSLIPDPLDSNTLHPKLDPLNDEGGTGKFTFLLQVIDTSGNTYYDVQRAWIDNEPVKAAITGIAGLPPCADVYTQTHDGAFKTVNIQGTAWDRLIDPVDFSRPTSDNFAHYTVQFQKQGAAGFATLVDSPTPTPPRPMPLGVGTLTPWDLRSVDAALNPLMLNADQLLQRGQECEYTVFLQVWDSTVVNESTVHYDWKVFPIKIINGPEPL